MAHVGAVLQEVGRAAVPERVGGHPHVIPAALAWPRTRSWMRFTGSRVPRFVRKRALLAGVVD